MTALLLGLGFERVTAFELGPDFDKLQADFSGLPSVTLRKAALGHVHNQMVWFGGVTAGKTPKLWYADAERPGNVRMVRFDDEFPSAVVDLVKLDVECGELNAIKGMTETLLANRPVVVCETADWFPPAQMRITRQPLFDYMIALGYEVAARFKGETVWV